MSDHEDNTCPEKPVELEYESFSALVQPDSAIVEPDTSLVEPATSLVQPDSASALDQPDSAVVQPKTALNQPDSALVQLDSASAVVQPDSALVQPNSALVQPDSALDEPETSLVQLDSASTLVQPDSAVVQPESALNQPDSVLVQPDSASAVVQPDSALVQPDSALVERDTAFIQPDSALLEPAKGYEDNMCPEQHVESEYDCDFALLQPDSTLLYPDSVLLQPPKIKDHMTECTRPPEICRYKNMGCPFTGDEEELKSHEKSALDDHLELITVFTANTDLENLRLRNEMQQLTSENKSMTSVIHDVTSQLTEMREKVDAFQQDLQFMQVKLSSQCNRISALENQLTSRDLVERKGRLIFALKNEQDTATKRMNQLERAGPAAGNSAVPGRYADQMQRQDRDISLQDYKLTELELGLQILETASYNGILIWKIQNYRRRKQDAIDQRFRSLYSQPFYTSKYGYKMCARAYLNGDGMGRGSHLSVFFVVMKGEFDALLPWPFRQKVTFMLLDQDTGERNISTSFLPDQYTCNCCFQRPVLDMNIASGVPLFVTHLQLETGDTYCRDDAVFIKIIVDTEGLNTD